MPQFLQDHGLIDMVVPRNELRERAHLVIFVIILNERGR